MTEKTFLFGDTKSLVGIVTDSPARAKDGEPLGVIFLNAGLIHRVGPNRLYVKLARRLAESGATALRFDLSGIGDSRARRDRVSLDQRAIVETKQAMDSLSQSRGIKRFALVGLCSGADNALRIACADSRVAGAVLIDAHYAPTMGFYVDLYLPRLLRPKSWRNLISGRSWFWSLARKTVSARLNGGQMISSEVWKTISREELLSGVQSLAEGGVDVLLVYSGESPAYYHYRKSLRKQLDQIRAKGKVRVSLFPESDHTFTRVAQQTALIDLIGHWAQKLATP